MNAEAFDLFNIPHAGLFLAIIPLVAFLYAAVGHGGASGYLAIMALFSFPITIMKPAALLLNILVAGVSFYQFWKSGYFKWKLFYPFAITSIPASFVGGYMNVNPVVYKQILGILLIITVARMVSTNMGTKRFEVKNNRILALIIGASIGFFSGLIGIGGGIILSPVILLFGWGDLKETAAVSALFIWVNSIAGMSGLLLSGVHIPSDISIIALFALAGGLVGGYYGSKRIKNQKLKFLLSFVLIIAAFKLLFV